MASETHNLHRVRVCRVGDFPPGERIAVEAGGRRIGVFNIAGEYFALADRCPHRGAPLCLGRLVPPVGCDQAGRVTHGSERSILRCPWHQWEFDVRTGRAVADSRFRVRIHPVVIEGDEVILCLPASPGNSATG